MELEMKKNAVDLTDLALGILILGITVTIGANVLINVRDNTLTGLPVDTTANESVNLTAAAGNSDTFANTWVSSTSATCINASNAAPVPAGNYTISVNSVTGLGTITNATPLANLDYGWNCTYTTYDTTQADWALPDQAATGIAEYGNWFDIIVIVGIAGLILALIFMAFGNRGEGQGSVSY